MQIRIEIDVKPEELRRFLGLPDMAGVQEEFINFLRDKIVEANETFDPTAFLKANFDTLRKNAPFKRLLETVRQREPATTSPAPAKAPAKKSARKAAKAPRKRRSAAQSPRPAKRAAATSSRASPPEKTQA